MVWDNILRQIDNAGNILLLPHVNADGDALGSCCALALYLRSAGKKVFIAAEEAPEKKLMFLNSYLGDGEGQCQAEYFTPDLAIAVDTSGESRLGARYHMFENAPARAIIDHHAVGTGMDAETVCNPRWAATAEGIYELICLMGFLDSDDEEMIHRVSVCIYTALVTDTGCFAYSNVTENTHAVASAVISAAGDVSWIYKNFYETKSRGEVALMKYVYGKMSFVTPSICYLELTKEDFDAAGALDEDAGGVSSLMRSVEGVHAAVFVRPGREEGTKKLSLRSDEYCDCARCCGVFGGGGHARAAGLSYKESMGDYNSFIAELIKALEEDILQNERLHQSV